MISRSHLCASVATATVVAVLTALPVTAHSANRPTAQPSHLTASATGSARPTAPVGRARPVPAPKAVAPIHKYQVIRIGLVRGHRALVDQAGRTLYLFTNDRPGHGSTCYQTCAQHWPALVGKARAGWGVHAHALGTARRHDGRVQVTYHGWPLYYFALDKRPGDARGQGLGGTWWLIDVNGRPIRR